ncbi:hypothetical protein PGTUg99_003774 [Puccinia graminis f. sp. tritici]|uniref:Uncharacterized protein n=1 Tax=Puccinia graminis f. sp. tritici TaxID=56615 RepID=A0A5B0N7E8_PUCGR|nr:hypothetical protein PGTUg99_003774 [Puccinia graminis f. sp. tritici]
MRPFDFSLIDRWGTGGRISSVQPAPIIARSEALSSHSVSPFGLAGNISFQAFMDDQIAGYNIRDVDDGECEIRMA